jgi:phage-related protein
MSWQVEFLNEKKFLKLISKFSRANQRDFVETLMSTLSTSGPGVISNGQGKALGGGLYEYRLESAPDILLRAFFIVREQELIVVLSAYDKKANDSKTWQNRQILAARNLQKGLDQK